MRCDLCERDAMFVVYCSDEIRFVCATHLERFGEFPFEQVGSSPLIRASLDEAERVLSELLAGKIVRLIHLRHPEVHWAKFDREQECVIEKAVNSLTGKILRSSQSRDLQAYFEILGQAIANGWIATSFQPEIFSDGGER